MSGWIGWINPMICLCILVFLYLKRNLTIVSAFDHVLGHAHASTLLGEKYCDVEVYLNPNILKDDEIFAQWNQKWTIYPSFKQSVWLQSAIIFTVHQSRWIHFIQTLVCHLFLEQSALKSWSSPQKRCISSLQGQTGVTGERSFLKHRCHVTQAPQELTIPYSPHITSWLEHDYTFS